MCLSCVSFASLVFLLISVVVFLSLVLSWLSSLFFSSLSLRSCLSSFPSLFHSCCLTVCCQFGSSLCELGLQRLEPRWNLIRIKQGIEPERLRRFCFHGNLLPRIAIHFVKLHSRVGFRGLLTKRDFRALLAAGFSQDPSNSICDVSPTLDLLSVRGVTRLAHNKLAKVSLSRLRAALAQLGGTATGFGIL